MGCPSLAYVYDMSWAEFCIRSYAYRRQEKARLIEMRELLYTTLIAPHYDPKKLPKTRESFMPLEGKKQVTEKQKEAFLAVAKEYYQKKKKQNG